MNSQSIIQLLTKQYPGRMIIKNNDENPTEIICETEPTPGWTQTDHFTILSV